MCPSTRGQAIVIVTPLVTGAAVAAEATSQGYAVIAVWSKDVKESDKLFVPPHTRDVRYHADVQEKATLQATAAALKAAALGLDLVACIAGAENGVSLADSLSLELGLRSNGVCAGRRNKQMQQELVKDAGLRSVRQASGKQWSDVKSFVESESMPMVLKPVESAGSDGVKLCFSVQEANEHFHVLMNSQMRFGEQIVLCQEFLKGKEYVVDHVSRDGVHKVVMVWVYDKRPANGCDFVYHGMIPLEADSCEGQQLIPYVQGVLDSLGVRNGPSHGEVIMTSTGPCLVEMNCRANGSMGAWAPLVKALTGGYDQVSATVNAFTDADAFNSLPDRPPSPFLAYGQEVHLVSYTDGLISSSPGFERILQMKSFVSMDVHWEVGAQAERTVDCFSSPGSVILVHRDPSVVENDMAEIRQMEVECALFKTTPNPWIRCLETPQLLLRPYQDEDAAKLLKFWEISHDSVIQWCSHALPWKTGSSESRHARLLACSRYIAQLRRNLEQKKGWLTLALIDKSTKEVVGEIGTYVPDKLDVTEFGYMIRADQSGKGFATEASRRFISWALEPQAAGGLGINCLRVGCHVSNVASRRIPEKLGLHRICPGEADYNPEDPFFWRVAACEWDLKAHTLRPSGPGSPGCHAKLQEFWG